MIRQSTFYSRSWTDGMPISVMRLGLQGITRTHLRATVNSSKLRSGSSRHEEISFLVWSASGVNVDLPIMVTTRRQDSNLVISRCPYHRMWDEWFTTSEKKSWLTLWLTKRTKKNIPLRINTELESFRETHYVYEQWKHYYVRDVR